MGIEIAVDQHNFATEVLAASHDKVVIEVSTLGLRCLSACLSSSPILLSRSALSSQHTGIRKRL